MPPRRVNKQETLGRLRYRLRAPPGAPRLRDGRGRGALDSRADTSSGDQERSFPPPRGGRAGEAAARGGAPVAGELRRSVRERESVRSEHRTPSSSRPRPHRPQVGPGIARADMACAGKARCPARSGGSTTGRRLLSAPPVCTGRPHESDGVRRVSASHRDKSGRDPDRRLSRQAEPSWPLEGSNGSGAGSAEAWESRIRSEPLLR